MPFFHRVANVLCLDLEVMQYKVMFQKDACCAADSEEMRSFLIKLAEAEGLETTAEAQLKHYHAFSNSSMMTVRASRSPRVQNSKCKAYLPPLSHIPSLIHVNSAKRTTLIVEMAIGSSSSPKGLRFSIS